MAAEVDADATWPQAVRVVRSARRRKTVGGRIERGAAGETVVVMVPARLPQAETERLAGQMVERLRAARTRRLLNAEQPLDARASELNHRYFAGRLRWQSIAYVTDQERRHGSCTPSRGVIRLSHRLASVPDWVRDYVIVHELAHLEYPDHSPAFWSAVNGYPLSERARGYLLAIEAGDG